MRRWKWRIASRVSRDFQGGYLTQPTSPPVIDLPLPVIKSLSGGKQAFVLDVRFFADFVRFSPKSGRIDTVTVESARDPKQSFTKLARLAGTCSGRRRRADSHPVRCGSHNHCRDILRAQSGRWSLITRAGIFDFLNRTIRQSSFSTATRMTRPNGKQSWPSARKAGRRAGCASTTFTRTRAIRLRTVTARCPRPPCRRAPARSRRKYCTIHNIASKIAELVAR